MFFNIIDRELSNMALALMALENNYPTKTVKTCECKKSVPAKMEVCIQKTTTNNTMFKIKEVLFQNPITLVKWADGTQTRVRCSNNDTYSKETGLAMCFMKKALGNHYDYYDAVVAICEETTESKPTTNTPTDKPKKATKQNKTKK